MASGNAIAVMPTPPATVATASSALGANDNAFATFNTGTPAATMTLDLGTVVPGGEHLAITWRASAPATTVTADVAVSTDNISFTSLGTITCTRSTAITSFVNLPAGTSARYVRLTRISNLAMQFDGVSYAFGTLNRGVWSGPGVTGSSWDPSAQSGPVTITYTMGGTTGCSYSTAQTIQVDTPPANAVLTTTASGTLCPNNNSGTLNLTAYSGGIVRWESSTSAAFSAPTIIANTTATQSFTNLAVTTYYRVFMSNSCGSGYSNVVQITVADNAAPTFASCPANITVNNANNLCTAPVTYTTPVGLDNCPGLVTTRPAGLASGSQFPIGTTTVTHRATAANGMFTECTFTVTVVDAQLPAITCPGNVAQNVTAGTCGRVVTFTAPVGTDNCPGATTTQIAGLPSGSNFPVGINDEHFPGDRCGREHESVLVHCVDHRQRQPRLHQLPREYDRREQHARPVRCDRELHHSSGNRQLPGLHRDAHGRSSERQSVPHRHHHGNARGDRRRWHRYGTCTFTVTVTDTELPQITCPANITVSTSTTSCNAVVSYTAPVGTDNCSGATTARIAGLASGSTFPLGTTTITHRVTASNGATANCSFTVTVVDDVPPAITCPSKYHGERACGNLRSYGVLHGNGH